MPSSCVDIREQFVCVIHACVCAFIVFHGSALTPKWCWGGIQKRVVCMWGAVRVWEIRVCVRVCNSSFMRCVCVSFIIHHPSCADISAPACATVSTMAVCHAASSTLSSSSTRPCKSQCKSCVRTCNVANMHMQSARRNPGVAESVRARQSRLCQGAWGRVTGGARGVQSKFRVVVCAVL